MSDPGKASLSINAPASAPYDPLSTIDKFADVQNRLNTNKLFQQTFMARQRAGQIIANAPSVEAGLDEVSRDPVTSAFAPEVASTLRQYQLATAQYSGEIQKQAQSGFEGALKSLPAVAADPSSWPKVMKGMLATLSPQARDRVAPALDMFGAALTDDLPDDPKASRQMFQQRMNGMLLSAGVTPEAIKGIYGAPGQLDVGGAIQPTMTAPAALGGGTAPVGQAFRKSLAPQVVAGVDAEGRPTTMTVGGGAPAVPRAPSSAAGGGNNPLMPRAAGASGNVLLSGPTNIQSAYNKSRADDFVAHYEQPLDERTAAGSMVRKNLEEVMGQMKDAKGGGGAATYQRLGEVLQAFGVKNDSVDKWANGSLPASQVITKLDAQNAINMLKQQLATGRITNLEFETYLKQNPNLSTDPRAVLTIANQWMKFYDRDKTEQKMLNLAKAGKPTGDAKLDSALAESGGFSPTTWPANWNQSSFMNNYAPAAAFSGAGIRGGVSAPAAARKALLDKYRSKK